MMEGWKQVKLADVCKINQSNINTDFGFDDITYLDISSVGSGNANFENIIPLNEAPSRAKRVPKTKDSIIATVRPGNKTFYYLKDFPKNTIVSTGFAVLTPNEDKIDSRFLYYIISEPSFTSYLVSIEQGANYPAVSAKDIAAAKIVLPPLQTQSKIASILTAYDNLIENNLKRIKLLEEQAQQTYEEWFVRMKFPGYETAVIDEESGLPVGWEKFILKDVIELVIDNRGKNPSYYSEKGIPVIDNYLITDSPCLDFSKCNRFLDELMFDSFIRKYLKPNDVLVTLVGNGYGSVSIAPKDKCVIIQNTIGLRSNDLCNQEFLYWFLASSKQNIQNRNRGSAQPSVKVGDLLSIKILIPNPELLIKFSNEIAVNFETLQKLSKLNKNLKEARDILLPRLMSGMIDPSASSGQVMESLEVDKQVNYKSKE